MMNALIAAGNRNRMGGPEALADRNAAGESPSHHFHTRGNLFVLGRTIRVP